MSAARLLVSEREAIERGRILSGQFFSEVGSTFVLTDTGVQSAIWVLTRNPPKESVLHHAHFIREAAAVWKDARAAIPRVAPMLLDYAPLGQGTPEAACLGRVRSDGPQTKLDIDGRSCGLAFALSLASSTMGVPLPTDLAAAADIDAHGGVRRVDGIPGKVRALAQFAPSVRRLLVAAGKDPDENDHAHNWRVCIAQAVRELGPNWTGIEVVPVADVAEAIGHAMPPERLTHALETLMADSIRRNPVLRRLYECAMTSGQTGILDWRPVAKALAHMYPQLACDLDGDPLQELRVLWMVAHRWARLPIVAADWVLPSMDWIRALHQPRRAGIAAQVVQTATDIGIPDRQMALQLGADSADLSTLGLKLRGAMARLRLRLDCGDRVLRAQMQEQRAVAVGFRECFEAGQTTYGLSEWARLAGVLRDREAFDESREFAADIEQRVGNGASGRVFVEISLARSAILLAEMAPSCEADQLLEYAFTLLQGTLAATIEYGDQRFPSASLRSLARICRARGDASGAGRCQEALTERVRRDARHEGSLLLLELDLRIAGGNPPDHLVNWLGTRGDAGMRELAVLCVKQAHADSWNSLQTARRFAEIAQG